MSLLLFRATASAADAARQNTFRSGSTLAPTPISTPACQVARAGPNDLAGDWSTDRPLAKYRAWKAGIAARVALYHLLLPVLLALLVRLLQYC